MTEEMGGRSTNSRPPMFPDWFDDETRVQDIVLSELDEGTQQLFKTVLSLQDGLRLLRFLGINGHTLLTVEDIAFNLKRPYAVMENGLNKLMELGLVKRVEVVGVVLYGLTDAGDKRQAIQELVEWQDRWQIRLARIAHVVEGTAPKQGGLEHG